MGVANLVVPSSLTSMISESMSKPSKLLRGYEVHNVSSFFASNFLTEEGGWARLDVKKCAPLRFHCERITFPLPHE